MVQSTVFCKASDNKIPCSTMDIFCMFLFASWTAYNANNINLCLIFKMTAQTHYLNSLNPPVPFPSLFEDFISSVDPKFGPVTLLREISGEDWLGIQLPACLSSQSRDSSQGVIGLRRLGL